MKIIYTLLFLVLFSNFSYPQMKKLLDISGNSYTIVIDNPNIKYNDYKKGEFTQRDYFEYTDPSKPGSFKLPSQTIILAIPSGSSPTFSVISKKEKHLEKFLPAINPKIVRLNDSSVVEKVENSLTGKNYRLDDNIIEKIGKTWYRDFYCVVLKINLANYNLSKSEIVQYSNIKIRIDLNAPFNIVLSDPIKLLSKYDRELDKIIYNNKIAEQFRANPNRVLNDTSGNWINYNLTYMKIGTYKDGLYRIYKSDLENFGINTASINPQTFQLFDSGVEQPIYVYGQEDGQFDDSDYIEYWGHKNYNKSNNYRIINDVNKPYNNYLNKYSDTTIFFLTWNFTIGNRIEQITNSITSQDTLDYYKSFIHTEKNILAQFLYDNELDNQRPFWIRNKTWVFRQTEWFYSGTQRNYPFNAPDLVPDKMAEFYFKLIGASSDQAQNSHNLIMKVNNVLLDSQVVNRYDQVLLNGTISTNNLSIGSNNITIKNYNNGIGFNGVATDWYDIEYPRYLNLINDSLLFKINNDIVSGTKIIKIGNINSNEYIIYKVNPGIVKFNNYSIQSNYLLFSDTVVADNEYVVINPSKITKPIFYYKKQFVNLRSITDQTDYIGITNPKFIASAQNYLNTISSDYNIKTSLYSVQDIYDEFGFGYPTPESIKLFVESTFQNRVEPKPSYLVLIGDADYDYKGYKLLSDNVRVGENYVPSFGFPVSDEWYAIWSDSTLPVPQLKVGRIPINKSEELAYYKSKVENNLSSPFNEWNKRYLFFSGGNSDNPSEINILRSVNQSIIDNEIKPKPIAGEYTHFYKTINPQTDFGPYTTEEFLNQIHKGSIFISYLGHSGTATWDNNINDIAQLENTVNRNPLITDFGCSTNKFAEPDIVCFGERFLLGNGGQAIGYIGNSSLGFSSTATTVPQLFYGSIVNDSIREIGAAHLDAKINMFNLYGGSDSYKIFSYTNTLLGDPTVQLKIPALPNLKIGLNDFLLQNNLPNDRMDSLLVKVIINNWGISNNDSVMINFNHSVNNISLKTWNKKIVMPDYIDTLNIWLSTKNKPGQHNLTISIDPENLINEIYEDDNETTYNFNVASSDVRDLISFFNENSALDSITVISPTLYNNSDYNLIYQVSENDNFDNYQENNININSPYKMLHFPTLQNGTRFWYRFKINDNSANFSQSKSFINVAGDKYFLRDSLSMNQGTESHSSYLNDKIQIVNDSINLSVLSAGWYAGATCVISKNDENLLSNTYFTGMGIVVFDSSNLEVDTSAWFSLFNLPGNVQALANMIDSISPGKIVLMGVADDAANNISAALKNAIHTLGSTKIDSLQFRGSWAIIGRKGASPGDCIEQVKGPYDGQVIIDSTFVINNNAGSYLTSIIGPSNHWSTLNVTQNTPSNSSIKYRPMAIKNDGTVDTLNYLTVNNGIADLSFINPKTYPYMKILAEFNAASDGTSPTFSSLGVNYTGVPELGTNYQVVSVDNDSVKIGQTVNLNFSVYNAGESRADSFRVHVDMVKPDNSTITLLDTQIDTLNSFSHRDFSLPFNTLNSGIGRMSFNISIDPQNKITELYKDNNYYTQPFYVLEDSTAPDVKITFDGVDIIDGDFVSANPTIKINLDDPSSIPITDTSAIVVYLNDEIIPYTGNGNILTYEFSNQNPKMVVTYKPTLKDGEYNLRVMAKNSLGNFADSLSSVKNFTVKSDAQLLYVYNYPNPFSGDTYFTFKLTQIPDELKIKIFTIAGRLVRNIVKPASELNYDFNRIFWNGRDEDGDLLANGVYLYKVIMKKGGKTIDVTQKLAIIR